MEAMWTIFVLCVLFCGGCTASSAQRLVQQVIPTAIPSAAPTPGSVSIIFPTVSPTTSPTLSPTNIPTVPPTTSPRSIPISTSNVTNPPSSSPYPVYTPRPIYPTGRFPTYSPSHYYGKPYYSMPPSNTYWGPTEPPSGKKNTLGISGIIIIVLVILTLIGICYGRSQFDQELDDDAVDTFHAKIFKNNRLVIQIPTSLPFPRKEVTYVPYVLFFSTRIKMMWVKPLAILQFVIGWIACFTSFVGFIYPDNITNNNIGTAALFLSELLLHIWYGYIRYWNPSWLFLQCDPDWDEALVYARASLQQARESCTQLYHKDREFVERKTDMWIIVVGHIFSIPLHVGSIIGSCLACVGLTVLSLLGSNKGDFGGNVRLVGIISAVIGSLVYPILFRRGDVLVKVLSSIGHHICLEYYEARHFGKSSKQFIISVLGKPLGDLFPGEAELPDLPDLDEEKGEKKSQNKNEEGTSNDEVDTDEPPVTNATSSERNDGKERRDDSDDNDVHTEDKFQDTVKDEINISPKSEDGTACRDGTVSSAKDSIHNDEEIEIEAEVGDATNENAEANGKESNDDTEVETKDTADNQAEGDIEVEPDIEIKTDPGEISKDGK